jgi:hypothetical protein
MRVRIDGPFAFRLPAAAIRRQERLLLLRILAGWALLGLLWALVG